MEAPDLEPAKNWEQQHRRIWRVDGIVINHQISAIDGVQRFTTRSSEEFVRLHFGLLGDYRFTHKQLGESFDLAGGHHNVMYSKGLDLIVENKTDTIETFGISFPTQLFLDLTEDAEFPLQPFTEAIRQGRGALLSEEWGSINISIQNVIDQILLNPYGGRMEQIYVLAKALELLVLCLDDYGKKVEKRFKYLRNKLEKERIIAARDYLTKNLKEPPSLIQVSKAVGVNEFKLKHGFKEMFGTTVFGYLRARRLELAKHQLIGGQKEITAIALDLGYSSAQHFHTQFKKHFGVTPNYVRNNP